MKVDVEKEIESLVTLVKEQNEALPKASPIEVDIGLANIEKVGKLMSQGLGEIFIEAAKRSREAGQKAVNEAAAFNARMEKIAADCEKAAAEASSDVEKRTARGRELCEGASRLAALITAASQLTQQR
jgi:hypothetical protein